MALAINGFETDPLIPNRPIESIQRHKDRVIRFVDESILSKSRYYKKWVVGCGGLFVACLIGLIIFIVLMIPRVYTPSDVLFAQYNASLTSLLADQNAAETIMNDAVKDVNNIFAPVFNDPQWDSLQCEVIHLCWCQYTSTACDFPDFTLMINVWAYINDAFPFCNYIWTDTPAETQICYQLYQKGSGIEQQVGYRYVNDIQSYAMNKKRYNDDTKEIKKIRLLIQNDFPGLRLHISMLITYIVVILVFLILIAFIIMVFICLKRNYKKELDDLSASPFPWSSSFKKELAEQNITITNESITTILNRLSDQENRIRFQWLRMLAFLGGSLRPESTTHRFLHICGKDIKQLIIRHYFDRDYYKEIDQLFFASASAAARHFSATPENVMARFARLAPKVNIWFNKPCFTFCKEVGTVKKCKN